MTFPSVALIGRPNVGKSTLFNRLIRGARALVHDQPGITRDRLHGVVRREGLAFGIIDTGGVSLDEAGRAGAGPERLRGYEELVLEQAKQALAEAAVLCLVVDGREGLLPLDERLARFLRESGKPVLLAVNKVDGEERAAMAEAEFFSLGLDSVVVSAAHGLGIGELVRRLGALLPGDAHDEAETVSPASCLRLAFLGRPNAGKSSLVNRLVGLERMIVSEQPGSTRDSVDVTLDVVTPEGEIKRYTFVDTAGIRRRARITDTVERFSVNSSLKSGRKADLSVLLIDAIEGLTTQDKRLLDYLDKEKLPFIALVNKIDLVPREQLAALKRLVEQEMRICSHVPVLYVSARTGKGVDSLLPAAEDLYAECGIRVTTGKLNRFIADAVLRHQPPTVKGRRAKFYYMTQADVRPPTFVFFVNDPDKVKPAYARYLEKEIRNEFGLPHAPVIVHFRPRTTRERA